MCVYFMQTMHWASSDGSIPGKSDNHLVGTAATLATPFSLGSSCLMQTASYCPWSSPLLPPLQLLQSPTCSARYIIPNYQQNSYLTVIGVHLTMHLMHPNYCLRTFTCVSGLCTYDIHVLCLIYMHMHMYMYIWNFNDFLTCTCRCIYLEPYLVSLQLHQQLPFPSGVGLAPSASKLQPTLIVRMQPLLSVCDKPEEDGRWGCSLE